MTGSALPGRGSSLLGIQYLRGIASIMVVFHHAWYLIEPEISIGFGATGVDIFFVISGFIMAYSYSRAEPASAPDSSRSASRAGAAMDFWLKRLIRVAPLYWVALAIAWRSEIFHGQISVDLVKDFLFVPRIYSLDDPHIWPKLIPGWTINCEMFFYLLFGGAILFSRHTLRLTLAIILALSTLGFFLQPQRAPLRLYTWSVFLEFSLGILLYLISRNTAARPIQLRIALLAVAITALAYASRDGAYEYSSWRFLIYGVPAAVIVWTSLQAQQKTEWSLLKLLGDASYSIYLFHSTVGLRLGLRAITALRLQDNDWFSVSIELAIYLVISVAAGVAMHRILERPLLAWMRRGEAKIARPKFGSAA